VQIGEDKWVEEIKEKEGSKFGVEKEAREWLYL
jgi:hypothetical protein